MEIPRTYTVVDTETTGLTDPFVVQFGSCVVRDNEVVIAGAINIRRPADIVMTSGAFNIHKLTDEHLNQTGLLVQEAMHTVRDMLSQSTVLMGHNVLFDLGAINGTMRYAGVELIDFRKHVIIDTGILVKAHRMGIARKESESTFEFLNRVRNIPAKGMKWNLNLALEMFKVANDRTDRHNAGDDCKMTHLLFQALIRELIVEGVLNGKPDAGDRPGVSSHRDCSGVSGPVGGRVHAVGRNVFPH